MYDLFPSGYVVLIDFDMVNYFSLCFFVFFLGGWGGVQAKTLNFTLCWYKLQLSISIVEDK